MAKRIKGSLFEKLQELKEWQVKQQEKLSIQQKEQEEMLYRHQRQKELLGLREIEVDANIKESVSTGDHVYSSDREPKRVTFQKTTDDIKMNKLEKDKDAGNVSLDDVPVNSAMKDFHELLEERLKKEVSGINDKGENISDINKKPKRPFLKKGEGLKRFQMNCKDEFTKTHPLKCKTRVKNSTNLTHSAVLKKEKSKNVSSKLILELPKDNRMPSGVKHTIPVNGNQRNNGKGDSQASESSTWADVLSFESEKQKESDISVQTEKKGKGEAEDLQVFEILEQMAGDSSFCSTSSTLLGFMETPTISTPLKAILEQKEKFEAKPSAVSHIVNKCTKELPFGMDSSGDSDSSKDEFDSSSESCYSASEKPLSDRRFECVAQGTSRVRFSNHVEEREYDAELNESSRLEPFCEAASHNFKDTEAWSDSVSDESETEDGAIVSAPNTKTIEDEMNKKQILKSTSVSSVEKGISCRSVPLQNQDNEDKDQIKGDPPDIVFKTELLHKRLLELEHEIEIFRKENGDLLHRKQLQDQVEANWLKQKREIEKQLKEKEDILKETVLEERRKLNREKQVFEKYCKDIRNQPTKQERMEIQSLREKLIELQQELRQKENRNSAAQTRITNRLKALEKENTELKEEIEKLKKEKQLASRKRPIRLASNKNVSNTKSIHSINQQVNQITVEDIIIHDVVPTRPIPPSLLMEEAKAATMLSSKSTKFNGISHKRNTTAGGEQISSLSANLNGISLRRIQSAPSLKKKSDNLELSPTECPTGGEMVKNKALSEENDHVSDDDGIVEKTQEDEYRTDYTEQYLNREERVSEQSVDRLISPNIGMLCSSESKCESSERNMRDMINKTIAEVSCESLYPNHQLALSKNTAPSKSSSVQIGFPVEKVNPDGSREIRYENGNFKRISPDGLITKLFYFNGDVKETLEDGTIKYYYSETRTWHTTFTDGVEVLEFPNGQVERHFNGTKEVSFPDGTVRLLHQNGKEEVMLPDGTVATTEPNGDKVIEMPNGQKEYQTRDYMKRIFPDGTVKIVYPDGVQETRYSNGRIRLKDSNGSLVMDSES